jgi:hypothetical protein
MAAEGEQLVPVFMPALGPLLIHAEDLKGEPLSHDEVIRPRNECPSDLESTLTGTPAQRARPNRSASLAQVRKTNKFYVRVSGTIRTSMQDI